MCYELVDCVLECGDVFRGSERQVLGSLAKRANSGPDYCFPSYRDIRWTGQVSKSASLRAMTRLQEMGVVIKLSGGGRRSNQYWINRTALELMSKYFIDEKQRHKKEGGRDWLNEALIPLAQKVRDVLLSGKHASDSVTSEEDAFLTDILTASKDFKENFARELMAPPNDDATEMQKERSHGNTVAVQCGDPCGAELWVTNKESNKSYKKIADPPDENPATCGNQSSNALQDQAQAVAEIASMTGENVYDIVRTFPTNEELNAFIDKYQTKQMTAAEVISALSAQREKQP